ncbi:hypothetical protein, partial [Rhodococcus qingshengii]|uniref:hypothetical protein n=1 Tax=Rhodococcus qingshengii TaxID=334542 RepID=UPI001C8B21BA
RFALWNHECDRIDSLRAGVEREFPGIPQKRVDLSIASVVIQRYLGKDWVEANIESPTEGKSGRATKTSSYLRREPETLRERREQYIRVMELARRIFELEPEPFAKNLFDNLRRRDLEGAAFEADVIRMLVSLQVVINLREERQVKGDDYDIDLWLKPEIPWAIEVKTKAEESGYTAKRFLNTLEKARGQLPADGMGGIFMKIPTLWTEDADYAKEHHAKVTNFLTNTSRVHAIVLVWDAWTDEDRATGWGWSRSHQIFKSPNITPNLDQLLTFYQQNWDNPHDLIAPRAPF